LSEILGVGTVEIESWIGKGESRKSFIRSSWWRYSISLESFSFSSLENFYF